MFSNIENKQPVIPNIINDINVKKNFIENSNNI